MSHAGWNDLIWGVSVALQCGLVVELSRRGVARRWRVFTGLLAFYSLRATTLFALFGHLAPEQYSETYGALVLVDLVLQMAVAMEMAVHLLREWREEAAGWRFMPVLTPLASLCASVTLLAILPKQGPLRPDRVQVFDWFVLALLCGCTWLRPTGRVLRSVAGGLGLYAVSSLVAMAARMEAALRRDAVAFRAWSYVTPVVWVAVLAGWLWLLREDAAARPERRESAAVA